MIEFKGVSEFYSPTPLSAEHRAVRKAEAGQSVSGVDVVQFSPEATFRSKLDAVAKTARADSIVSSQRLDALKAQYRDDACPVSAADAAQSIVDRMAGGAFLSQGVFL